MAHKLDAYADLAGKLSPEKIAETAGVPVAEVEAWLAGADPEPEKKASGKPAKAKPQEKPVSKPRTIEVIRVKQTTAISVETRQGKRVRVTVPRSIYRGKVAREYVKHLKAEEYDVLGYAD